MSTTEEKLNIKFYNEPLDLSDQWPDRTIGRVSMEPKEAEAPVSPENNLIGYDTIAFNGGVMAVRIRNDSTERLQ